MMDHYEELGVSHTASPEEIRLAYKRLVKLLHPDHCGDDEVRRLAELQMIRLNAILAIISNPVERESYDRSLIPAPPARQTLPTPSASDQPWWLWPVVAGVLLAGVLSVLIGLPDHQAPAVSVEPAAESTPVPAKTPIHSARVRATAPKIPAPIEGDENDVPADALILPPLEAAPARQISDPAVRPPQPPSAPAFDRAAEPVVSATPVSSIAGEWLFVSSSDAKAAGLSPPEYIELRVTESSGILRGRYRGRYHVNDKAISPTVSFQFEGRPGYGETKLPW